MGSELSRAYVQFSDEVVVYVLASRLPLLMVEAFSMVKVFLCLTGAQGMCF